jgi:hypothetical protein
MPVILDSEWVRVSHIILKVDQAKIIAAHVSRQMLMLFGFKE